jgi:dTDP-4-amino-4,6-dideoxygalactose transaminase
MTKRLYIWVMGIPSAPRGLRESDIELISQAQCFRNFTSGAEEKNFGKLMREHSKFKNFVIAYCGLSANLLKFEAFLLPVKSKPRLHLGARILAPTITWTTNSWLIIKLGLIPIFADVNPKNTCFGFNGYNKNFSCRYLSSPLFGILNYPDPVKVTL